MIQHSFGGPWTEQKLDCLRNYLKAYRTIFTRNPKARRFTTWYVDAFAGTGKRWSKDLPAAEGTLFDEVYEDAEPEGYRTGSAIKALGLDSPFDHYLFIEQKKSRIDQLRTDIKRDFPALLQRCQFEAEEANEALTTWCAKRDSKKERAVVFLDPYGMEVKWSTVQELAATKAVDVWYLFPVVTRLLTVGGNIDPKWENRLNLLFGTDEWRSRFYPVRPSLDLFGEHEKTERDASVENMKAFIQERLATCFVGVADGLVLRNSKTAPLYLLSFAASNERGAKTAVPLAESILRPRLTRRRGGRYGHGVKH